MPKLSPVLHLFNAETGVCEQGLHFVRCGQVAVRRCLGPRHREGQPSIRTLHHVVDAQHGAALQHPGALAIEAGAVLDIHRHVQRDRCIERRVGERHAECAADLERRPVAKSGPLAECTRRVDVLRRQIDARHAAPGRCRHVARRPANAAADVEHVLGAGEAHLGDGVLGGGAPADVEFIDRSKIVGRKPVYVEAGGRGCLQHPFRQRGDLVVARNRALMVV